MSKTEDRIRKHGMSADKRHFSTKATRAKKAEAGRQGRGRDIHSVKRDLTLEARIEMVVRKALRDQLAEHCTDVMNGFRHVAHSTLRAHRVG